LYIEFGMAFFSHRNQNKFSLQICVCNLKVPSEFAAFTAYTGVKSKAT
jgi:hypothetical protein